jgi:hypothetical protein
VSYPPDASASEQRCTVTGHMNGDLYSLVIKELPGGDVVVYPHGVDRDAVRLGHREQQVLGRWLLGRETTRRRSQSGPNKTHTRDVCRL